MSSIAVRLANEKMLDYSKYNASEMRALFENSQSVLEKERKKNSNLALSLIEYEKNAALMQDKINKLLSRLTKTKEHYQIQIQEFSKIQIELKQQIEIKEKTIIEMKSKLQAKASPSKVNELQTLIIDLKNQLDIKEKMIIDLKSKVKSETSTSSKVEELQNIIIDLRAQNTSLSNQINKLISNNKEFELNKTIESLQSKVSELSSTAQQYIDRANHQKELFNKVQNDNIELKNTLSTVNKQLIDSLEQNKKLNKLLDISKQKEESFNIQTTTANQNVNKYTQMAKELAEQLSHETEKYAQLEKKYEELSQKSSTTSYEEQRLNAIISNLREENDRLSAKNRELNNTIFTYNMDKKYKITPKNCKCCCDTDNASREHRECVRIEGELIRIKSENVQNKKELEFMRENSLDLKKYGFLLADAVGSSFDPDRAEEEIKRLLEIAREHHQKVNDTARVPLDPFDY
ncbi:hypothetical protein TVAG_424570 [Trichomonas vaginalis G3]|uniref:Uncharacterized protein n=1 Tax=Trichomonas vaginalis (strain ATCC PRA-98 / G3) TaxID=412133 RepID=A2E1U6_TRIV3|nr:hypothetical protein TVAGG3_0305090 [Trichomonas vaginalis G3]EAY13425.1 hypothetical protein TVAG_424570 [Trichomonas vaginalis G3]KAI5528199.1 hypothetical protein TVAGG3_0305090 [Trichomonas vaginalis G3]|eukprot:XP_001325648.1 hypothetical protein [Trichomonas vaginalis G3]